MTAVPVVVMTDNGRRSLNGAAVTEWDAGHVGRVERGTWDVGRLTPVTWDVGRLTRGTHDAYHVGRGV